MLNKLVMVGLVGTLGAAGCGGPEEDVGLPAPTALQSAAGGNGAAAQAALPNVSAAAAAEVDDYLEHRVARETIRATLTRGENTFDCVDELEQPTVRQLRQKTGLAIRALETPPDEPRTPKSRQAPGGGVSFRGVQVDGGGCPSGSVPIRRIHRDEILRFGSLKNYFAKRPPPSENNYEYGTVGRSGDNNGGEATINEWNPYVEAAGEHSIAQIWVSRGTQKADHTGTLETVEAGWVKRTGANAVLFVYSTTNDYSSGCWNTDCAFVAYANTGVYLDAGFQYYSSIDGPQYDQEFEIRKSSTTGSWFFYLDNVAVGYWPLSFFNADNTGIRQKASRFLTGGEVYGFNDGAHTQTDMGSGLWPYQGWQKSAYIRNIRYRTTGNVMTNLASTSVASVTDRECYDGIFASGGTWASYMYFGGSGYNSKCP
jgi:hypothetical protein